MPLYLVCPCGRKAPLPEHTGRYRCQGCGRVHPLTWFEAPGAWDQWQEHVRTREPRESPRVEFFPEEQPATAPRTPHTSST